MFQKGVVTNPNGRPKNSPMITPLVRKYMDLSDIQLREECKKTTLTQKDQIAIAIVKEVKKGGSRHLATVWDRMDGKQKSEVDVTTGGEQLAHLLIVTTQESNGTDKS
jgi:hypothetical protein